MTVFPANKMLQLRRGIVAFLKSRQSLKGPQFGEIYLIFACFLKQKSNKFHQIVGPLDFLMPFKDCLDFSPLTRI
jgi:hypothetical protein